LIILYLFTHLIWPERMYRQVNREVVDELA
jgi:hypothetical protein